MVHKCVVLGCGSKWYPNCSVIFHSFPKDPIRRNQWLSAVKLKTKFYETASICSNHFAATDYLTVNRLNGAAIPMCSDESEQSEPNNDMPSVLRQILLSTPSTSRFGLSDSPAMSDQSELDTSSVSVFSHKPATSCFGSSDNLAMAGKTSSTTTTTNTEGECFIENETADDISCPKKIKRKENKGEIIILNLVEEENIAPPRPSCATKSVQVKLRSKKEVMLQKKNKVLLQKIKRQERKIDKMQSLIRAIKEYTNNSEIENIVQGNFANLCKLLKKPLPGRTPGVRYSDEVKAFALTVHFYSPKTYEYLKKLVTLPHIETLRRCQAEELDLEEHE